MEITGWIISSSLLKLLTIEGVLLLSMDWWVVHKFGGTSVGSADCIKKCVNIIRPQIGKSKIAVVVSAMGGKPKVTDMLLDSVHAAANGNSDASEKLLQEIHHKHQVCVSDLLQASPKVAQGILNKISSDLRDINDLLRAVNLMKMAHEQILELVSGYGEVSLCVSCSLIIVTLCHF